MEIIQLDYRGHVFAREFTMPGDLRFNYEMIDAACLTYIDEGTQSVNSSIEQVNLYPNQAMLSKCGKYVAKIDKKLSPEGLSGVVFHLNPDIIKEAFRGVNIDFLHVNSLKEPSSSFVDLGESDLLRTFVDSMRPYFCSDIKIDDRLMGIKLQELVSILVNEGNNEVLNLLGTIGQKEVFDFEKVIDANLYNNLSIDELAHLSNLSLSSFKRKFKKIYDATPAAYFRGKRLLRAAELLKSSTLTIGDVCWGCGFESLSHFSYTFKKEYGASPREFRAQKP
tara:strand:- start:507 stop:1346 length:840 start_codon:yes stop_codon:yes gene_type:complete